LRENIDEPVSIESVQKNWDQITGMSCTVQPAPTTLVEVMGEYMKKLENMANKKKT